MAVVCGWCPRAWLWQLYVVGAHVCGYGSWMLLVLSSLVLVVGCGWLTTVCGDGRWMWSAAHVCDEALECGWCPRVWRWQLEVVGVHVFGGANWMWLVPVCVDVAVGCGPGHTRAAVAVGCGWRPRVWR